MHDTLPVFVVPLAHKKSIFKTLHANKWCGDNTKYNTCFLNLHSLAIQVKHASCVSEACDVIFAFVLRLKVQSHIQDFLKWGRNAPMEFVISTLGKLFVSSFSQYVTEMLNYPCASPQTPTPYENGRV